MRPSFSCLAMGNELSSKIPSRILGESFDSTPKVCPGILFLYPNKLPHRRRPTRTWSKPSRWSRRLLKRFYPKQTSNISEVAITGRAKRPRSNPRIGEILRPHECQGGEVASPVAALAPCCLPIRNALDQHHTIRTTSSPYSPSLS